MTEVVFKWKTDSLPLALKKLRIGKEPSFSVRYSILLFLPQENNTSAMGEEPLHFERSVVTLRKGHLSWHLVQTFTPQQREVVSADASDLLQEWSSVESRLEPLT
ncbi:hypothetical protein TNCV_2574001 [Trichonephila clavipes]|nr:hypothetical protein TNCV_2574001 [Trichonephila clavipes]